MTNEQIIYKMKDNIVLNCCEAAMDRMNEFEKV